MAYCRGATRDVHLLLDRFPGLVRFVFRNYPIPQLHPYADLAAQAAEAAAAQGKFWEMHELLLPPSSHLDLESLVGYASRIALDTDRFRDEVVSRAHASRIARDVREGIRNGVNAMPKLYVDGQRLDGHLPLEGLVTSVEAAVARFVSAR